MDGIGTYTESLHAEQAVQETERIAPAQSNINVRQSDRDSYLSGSPHNLYELDLKKEDHTYQLQVRDKEKEILDKKIGFLGRLFGDDRHSSKNITALICFVLIMGTTIISCIVYFTAHDVDFIRKMWTSISPIITLSLGYLFGNK